MYTDNDIININEDELNENDFKALAAIDQEQLESKIATREKLVRQLELQSWAEKRRIFKGAPKLSEIKRVWKKLKKGLPLYKAIVGVCSMTSWEKWRREYPAIAAMEMECRILYLEHLREENMNIANNPDTHMGSVARDKLMIDVRQREIDRNEGILDRIREAGYIDANKAVATTINPIQINITYGKEAKRKGPSGAKRNSESSGSPAEGLLPK